MEIPISSETTALYSDIAVLVPALNEAKTIYSLGQQLHARSPHVLVIDDASGDGTFSLATQTGVHVIRHETRKGKGAAIQTGLAWALQQPIKWIAVMDGDNQHSLTDLDRLARFCKQEKCDLAIGQRVFSTAMPATRRLTNLFMSAVLRFITGYAIADTQCGLKIMSVAAARNLNLRASGYEIESEMIIQASRFGLTVGSLPIQTIYNAGGKSAIRPVRDAVRWLWLLARTAR